MPLIVRVGASVVIALAMVCLPLLPPEHIHRAGIEDRTTPLVHAHALETPDTSTPGTSLVRSHGNHGLAIFLKDVYDSVPRVLSPPLLLVAATVVTVPPFRLIGLLEASLTQTAHGPPKSAWLTRGPPSLS
jgi:hypothetical protein